MKHRRWLMGSMLCLIFVCILYVRFRFLVVELSFDVNSMKKIVEKQERDIRNIRIEMSMLQNPKRIEKIAREELRLTYVEKNSNQQNIYIEH